MFHPILDGKRRGDNAPAISANHRRRGKLVRDDGCNGMAHLERAIIISVGDGLYLVPSIGDVHQKEPLQVLSAKRPQVSVGA